MKALGRKRPSILVHRDELMDYVKVGSAFRRPRDDNMTETAKIRSVYDDCSGIPHVRFDVVFEKPFLTTYSEGPRILSLETFFETFNEPVPT